MEKERSKGEELNKVMNNMEKNNTRLMADLKTIREKTEKVRFYLYL